MSDKNAVPSSAENQQPTESSTGRSFFVQVDGPRNVDTTDAGPDQASGDEEPVPEHQDPLSIMANAEDKKRKKKKKSKGKKKSVSDYGDPCCSVCLLTRRAGSADRIRGSDNFLCVLSAVIDMRWC